MKYFVSSKDFFNKVKISKSKADSELVPFIRTTQITHIKRILGSALYDELQEQMVDNTLSEANILLYPYIVDVHVYYSYQEYLQWASVNLTEYGFVTKNAAESESVPPEQLYKFINWAKEAGDTFCWELRQFLYNNREDYPLWSACINNYYYDNNFNSGSQWINIGKNLTGKRSTVKAEEAEKVDFKVAYNYWCGSCNYRI